MTPLDHDRTLALAYVPAARRPAVEALWRLDATLSAVLSTGREPLISQIRLAWWREALEKLDREAPPAEPILRAVAASLLPAGISGAALSEMEGGWALLLSPDPLGPDDLAIYAARRGGLLFRYTAQLLGSDLPAGGEAAGGAYALVDLARHSGSEADSEAALAAARATGWPQRWPSALRPLGMLEALARRDCELGRPRWEPHGAPGRMWRMLRHRLTGR
jgi:phytoene synthase